MYRSTACFNPPRAQDTSTAWLSAGVSSAPSERHRYARVFRFIISFPCRLLSFQVPGGDVPVAVRTQAALRTHKHRLGLLVALELPQHPVRRDVRELAAAGMICGGRVARAVPGAVKRREPVDRFV